MMMMMMSKKLHATTNMTMTLHEVLNHSENYSTTTDSLLFEDMPLFCFMIML
jgi:hypothetical protein